MEYDSLIDDNPEVQERVAKGVIKGKILALQQLVLDAVNEEYPPLAPLAQEKVIQLRKPEELRKLVKLIYKAPNEEAVRWLLDNYAA